MASLFTDKTVGPYTLRLKELETAGVEKNNIKNFIAAAKKYTDLTEIGTTVLRKFIGKNISNAPGKEGL